MGDLKKSPFLKKMKNLKIVSFAIAIIFSLLSLCCCFDEGGTSSSDIKESLSESASETVKESDGKNYPEYDNDFKITFTAYAPVPAALMNDDQFKNLSDAGFTKALGLYEGRVGLSEGMTESELDEKTAALKERVSADAEKALKLSEKYNIEYYVFNELIYNIERYTENYDKHLKSMLVGETYSESTAFKGHFLADEPSLAEMKKLVSVVDLYKKYMPEGEPFVNLLPCEDKKSQANYNAYLDYYFGNLANKLGYVSFDHYPYGATDGIDDMYLWNLEEISERAKDNDVQKRGFVWSNLSANGYHRGITSAADIRLQAYTNLAYGVDEMTYFVYSSNGDTDSKTNALINFRTGAKSNAYTWAKSVNNEVRSFEKAYGSFKWKGVMTFGSNAQFNELTRNLTSYERIKSANSSFDALIGIFEDEDNTFDFGAKNAFMIVNFADPLGASGKKNIELEFNDSTKVLLYRNGRQEIVDLTNGKLSLDMAVGDGAFVIPFN